MHYKPACLADVLKEWREDMGYTKRWAAQLLEVTPGQYSRWEKGEMVCGGDIPHIARVLNSPDLLNEHRKWSKFDVRSDVTELIRLSLLLERARHNVTESDVYQLAFVERILEIKLSPDSDEDKQLATLILRKQQTAAEGTPVSEDEVV